MGVEMTVAVVVMESAVPAHTLRPWLPDDPRVTVAAPGSFADLPAWVDRLGVSHVIVAARSTAGVTARLTATTLAAARPEVTVAHRVLPTTSVALAASALTALEAGTDAVSVLNTYDQLLRQSHSGTWLHSVTKLHDPKPGFGLHLRSMFTRGFVATTTPVPGVGRTFTLPPGGQPLLVGAEESSPAFAAVARLAGASPVQSVPVLADVSRAHGSAGAEFVALVPVQPLAGPVATCPSCHTRQARMTCPFCHVQLRVTEPA